MLRLSLAIVLAASTVPILAGACSGTVDAGTTTGGATGGGGSHASTGGSGPNGDAGTDADSGDGSCTTLDVLPLVVDVEDGVPVRLHTPVGYQDEPAMLLVDTGSGLTFLQEPLGSPDPVPDAATFQLGCLSLEVIGRPVAPNDPVDGVPTVGTLGIDLLTQGPTQLDFTGAQILFHAPGAPFPEAASWEQAPFDLIVGSVVVGVSLDGAPVRLIVDTGSPDTLWIGQQPHPGDIEVQTTDAYGNPLTLYEGTVDLAVGGAHRTVTVLRAPTFPNYAPPAPDVVGLLGLSSLGSGFVIDTDAAVVRINAP
jgi:hypothetical protein